MNSVTAPYFWFEGGQLAMGVAYFFGKLWVGLVEG